jgi:PTH1 family peptidyl-tRNA hydrolase
MPQTYMNLSGKAVGAIARFYKIEPDEVLVAHDELDFPPGTVKLKLGGGVAGHNGLKDIAAQLGTHGFWRLRIGIGHPGDKDLVADYVLHSPSPDDRALIDESIGRALEVAPLILSGDLQAATMRLHTKKKPPADAQPPGGAIP